LSSCPVSGPVASPEFPASSTPPAALLPRVWCLILRSQVVKRPWKSRLRLITKMEKYCDDSTTIQLFQV
jgi:hypothetical protein